MSKTAAVAKNPVPAAAAKPKAAPAQTADADDGNAKINALLPNEIIESFKALGDDAMEIEYKKMRANKDKTTHYGMVRVRKYDPKKPTGPHPLVPVNIMMVGLVTGGCPEKKPDSKVVGHSASFNATASYDLNGVTQRYGEARIQVAEVFKRKMEALIAEKKIPAGKITTGVQMDLVDPATVNSLIKTKLDLPREEWIIRVEIPFKKANKTIMPNAEPECIIRDIAQCKVTRLANGQCHRDYDKIVKISVEGPGGAPMRVPINYSNFHKFLVAGSKITGIERCDSWHISSYGNGLSHKFPEIIVARGSGKADFSLTSKLDSSIFDKMAAEAATDEQIEANRKAETLNGDGEGGHDDADMPPEDGAAPGDNAAPPEEIEPEPAPEMVDEAPIEEAASDEAPVEEVVEPEPPKPVVKPAAKPVPKVAPAVKPAEPKAASPKVAPAVKPAAPAVKAPVAKPSPKLTTPTSKQVAKPAAASPKAPAPAAPKLKPKAPTPPPIEEEEAVVEETPLDEVGEVVEDGDFDV